MSDDKVILTEQETSSWLNQPVKPKHEKKSYESIKLFVAFAVGFLFGAIVNVYK